LRIICTQQIAYMLGNSAKLNEIIFAFNEQEGPPTLEKVPP
jgi:hypothetical protein